MKDIRKKIEENNDKNKKDNEPKTEVFQNGIKTSGNCNVIMTNENRGNNNIAINPSNVKNLISNFEGKHHATLDV